MSVRSLDPQTSGTAPQVAGTSGDGNHQSVQAPIISLPKGGGAIRGIGEKFAANPVTGTGSLTVPIATSPGRSGFGPQLSLSYDTGFGNGPFGFGWNLSLPSITRKSDKGLPQYRDAEESDVFILSGAEDLVPVLDPDGTQFEDDTTAPGYAIHRYRPRIEGLFARIERWTHLTDHRDVHWRSISKDNILTLYGKDEKSRIADPEHPERIFSWLICQTRDDKGNSVSYEYKPEDGAGVDLTLAYERNRGGREDPRRTASRYIKHIRYGNPVPLLDDNGRRPRSLTDEQLENAGWLFEVVFDYGEHDANAPSPNDPGQWTPRDDPFSSYRAGFEVRTYRLCQRVLMFHHIPDLPTGEKGYDGLVRSTDFTYSHEQDPTSARNSVYTFLRAVTQSGYKRQPGSGYLKKSLPPVEFEYSQPVVQDKVEEVAAASLENLPIGVDGSDYRWSDLHGEGIAGILAEECGAWFYKRNLSPINVEIDDDRVAHTAAKFAPLELVATRPNLTLAGGQAQFMDLAGDGQPDLVVMEGPVAGLYEHDGDEGWQPFRPFTSRLNRDMRDPNLRFLDLDGDGYADVLITEGDALVWHPSLAEAGFGPAHRIAQALDEEQGPRLVFADGTDSIFLADMSGDGLTDLVRIRNCEVCYWPNLGYGRFGAKVTMDPSSDSEHPPCFDHPDQFDHKRIRLADIDGTGTTDIIYLHRDGVRLYFNQSGNSWSAPHSLRVSPRVDDLVTIAPTDLLGNGTACLVWSSPLPGDGQRQMRYVNLVGEQKPHLLTKVVNNLGADTRVEYAPSTKFYLQDKRDGRPWITRLPFPVHVVERVETRNHISGNRFVTRYAYHHGYFDGEEREFRGFGMVEQWDTEEFAVLSADGNLPETTDLDSASHVPPVVTRTWFHTGLWLGRDHVSDFFAGLLDPHDRGEYYREPAWRADDEEARKRLLPDTIMPPGLTLAEEREACRALKGAMLRQEVYALDGTGTADYPFGHPYTVSEQNFTIERLQPKGSNRHAVFFTHPREAITYHYERNPVDPRIQHALTLEVDAFGNVLKEAAIGYGRRQPDATLPLQADRDKQTHTLVTYTENRVAKAPITNAIDTAFDYRTPVPCESRTYELTGLSPAAPGERLAFDRVLEQTATASPLDYEKAPTAGQLEKRLIEHVRTYFRRNDLTGQLPLGELDSLALPFESYRLAFTPGLITDIYGGRVTGTMLENEGRYIHSEGDASWWVPSGRIFYSQNTAHTPAEELEYARKHFFLPHRYRNPFHTSVVSTESFVRYDPHNVLMLETRDALGNTVTTTHDYRVLQPRLVTDPNRNRTEVAFDGLGMVVATALMGKEGEDVGDLLEDFDTDPPLTSLQPFVADPRAAASSLLGKATTRIVYDLERYKRCAQPPFAATLARETHFHNPGGNQAKIQVSFAYSDGFGREIQRKIQAEAGEVPQRQPPVLLPTGDIRPGDLVRDAQGEPFSANTQGRWVGSGRTVFNNKGKPVRQYEPFFSATHLYEPEREMTDTGVSPVLFYDPVGRVVATFHPNDTYEKVVFDPWRQTTFDVNDTVAANGAETGDPRTDADIKRYVAEYFKTQPGTWQTWHQARITGAQGPHEKSAAEKAAKHANTPTTTYFDTIGRPFLTLAHNGFKPDGTPDQYPTRVELDTEGNQRTVRDAIVQNGDALGRIVIRYDYNMLRNRVHQASMEAGERWMLGDVMGNPIRAWDSRGFTRRMTYDELRRPISLYVTGNDSEREAERTVYGEDQGQAGNHRTRVYKVFDGAGVVTSEDYDFKGNLLEGRRDLLPDYRQAVDWLQNPVADDGSFVTRSTYDALNRPLTVTTPDGSVYRPTFNEANLLDKVDVDLRGAAASTSFVTDIDYNAKGQRSLIRYGNGAQTTYEYDQLTFRLVQLKTKRPAGLNGLAPIFADPTVVQDLRYTYDPAGNITRIGDAALNTIIHGGQTVEPVCEYTYDALYRLTEAKGREHIGQTAHNFNPETRRDYDLVGAAHPNDLQALRSYTEHYDYDAVGNFDVVRHTADRDSWTRDYDYEETSLVEPGKNNNRLTKTRLGNGVSHTEVYAYTDAQGNDMHGCMTAINDMKMVWDFEDQLQQVDLGGGGMAYYAYDAAGRRVRKAIHRQNGPRREERIYLGSFEIYREYNGGGQTVILERETLRIVDDKHRIALVETRTKPVLEQPLIRYQLGNHLGSASVELDKDGGLISYEEYHPYGTTSFQARMTAELSLKRYRYTGKERDEETGLSYHGARYYAPWIGRWTSCDPTGLGDGVNLYCYVVGNPIRFNDPRGLDRKDVIAATEKAKAYVKDVLTLHQELKASQDAVSAATEKYNAGLSAYKASGNTNMKALSELESARGSLEYQQTVLQSLEARAKELHSAPKLGFKGEKGLNEAREIGGLPPRTRGEQIAAEVDVELLESINHGVPAEVTDEARKAIQNVEKADELLGKMVTTASETRAGVEAAVESAHGLARITKRPPTGGGGATGGGAAPSSGGSNTATEAGKAATAEAKMGEREFTKAAEMGLVKRAGKYGAKALPFIGIGFGAYLVREDIKEDNYGRAAVDAAEAVPIVGDVVLAGDIAYQVSEWGIKTWSNFVAEITVSHNRQLRQLEGQSY